MSCESSNAEQRGRLWPNVCSSGRRSQVKFVWAQNQRSNHLDSIHDSSCLLSPLTETSAFLLPAKPGDSQEDQTIRARAGISGEERARGVCVWGWGGFSSACYICHPAEAGSCASPQPTPSVHSPPPCTCCKHPEFSLQTMCSLGSLMLWPLVQRYDLRDEYVGQTTA